MDKEEFNKMDKEEFDENGRLFKDSTFNSNMVVVMYRPNI